MLRLEAEARRALWRRLVEAIEEYTEGVEDCGWRRRPMWARSGGPRAVRLRAAGRPRGGARLRGRGAQAGPGPHAPSALLRAVQPGADDDGHRRRRAGGGLQPAARGLEPQPVRGGGRAAPGARARRALRLRPGARRGHLHLGRRRGEPHGPPRRPAPAPSPRSAGAASLALRSQPVLYVSAEAHHSFLKAARLSGLGTEAVREVRVDSRLRMSVRTTSGAHPRRTARPGARPSWWWPRPARRAPASIDPIVELAEVADEEGLWLHVDAAWGGAAALVPELRPVLDGIARASSITFDAHKWLSVPMGAGLYLTRHPGLLERTFRVAAGYMPGDGAGLPVADPYAHSHAVVAAVHRPEGLPVARRRRLGRLRAGDPPPDGDGRPAARAAAEEGWTVVNDTPLPVVCFVDGRDPRGGRRRSSKRWRRAWSPRARPGSASCAWGRRDRRCGPASPTTGRARRSGCPGRPGPGASPL